MSDLGINGIHELFKASIALEKMGRCSGSTKLEHQVKEGIYNEASSLCQVEKRAEVSIMIFLADVKAHVLMNKSLNSDSACGTERTDGALILLVASALTPDRFSNHSLIEFQFSTSIFNIDVSKKL